MAQTGYTPISLYYSTTASAAPTAGNLVAGELALNTVDEKLYFKNSSGTVKLLASSAGSSGDVVGPASATDKAIATFDGTTGKIIQNNSGVTITSGVITATGFSGPLNGTVGATTPTTGAFTTLAASGAITLSGGTANGVLYLDGSNVATSGSALTFDGTTFSAPNSVITSSSSSDALRITQTGAGNALLVEDSANPDSSPFVIDSTGRIVNGYTSPLTTFSSGTGFVQQIGTTSGSSAHQIALYSTTGGNNPVIELAKANSATIGTNSVVSSGNDLGELLFSGADGTNFISAASILAQVDGTPGTNDMPGRLVFKTTADGASSPTERMRIDSSGNVFVGATSTQGGGASVFSLNSSSANPLQVQNTNNSSPFGAYFNFSAAAPNNATNYFLICNDTGGTKFKLLSNGGLANFQANDSNLSDKREKTNFSPAKDYLDIICAIPVQTFNYIDQNIEEDDGLTLGVIAQDVQAVAPELVSESDWGTKEDPKMRLSIYQTDLQYALMKCIQELKAENDSLKARLDAAGL